MSSNELINKHPSPELGRGGRCGRMRYVKSISLTSRRAYFSKGKEQKITIIGVVRELSHQTLSIRTNEGYRLIEVADILEIRLWEEGVYD